VSGSIAAERLAEGNQEPTRARERTLGGGFGQCAESDESEQPGDRHALIILRGGEMLTFFAELR